MTDSALFLAVTALASVIGAGFVVLVWLKLRVSGGPQADVKLDQIIATQERFERTQRAEHLESQRQLRTELAESSRALRVEIAQADAEFRSAVARDAAAGR